MKNNKKGFTLIELLVVIAIIGLLSTLAVIALGSARQKARDSKRVSDIRQLQTALELYFTDQGAYPNAGGAAVALELGRGTDCTSACDTLSSTNAIGQTAAGTTYMALIPPDPSGTTECAQAAAAVCSYSYRAVSTQTTYCISFWLEGDPDGTGPLAAGAQNATNAGIQSGGCAF